MPELVAHCLAGIVCQSIVLWTLGLPVLSTSIFVAGLFAMLINIDYSNHTVKRTPVGHSVPFAAIWVYCGYVISSTASGFGASSPETVMSIVSAVSSAFLSHLLLDSLTPTGIFLYPCTLRIHRWFCSGTKWKRLSLCHNELKLLDMSVSVACLCIIIGIVAVV